MQESGISTERVEELRQQTASDSEELIVLSGCFLDVY
jgi:hypothetical protein